MPGIFISYRREDSAGYAGHLLDELSDHFGRDRVFMDIDTIEAGADFVEAIEAAVGSCDVLLAVIGSQWLTSTDADGIRRLDKPDDFVRLEIATALERNIRVIPVLVHEAKMPSPSDLPDSLVRLTRRNAIELSNARWEYDLGRLIAVLEKVVGPGSAPLARRAPRTPSADRRRRLAVLGLGGLVVAGACAAAVVWYFGPHRTPALPTDAIAAECGRVWPETAPPPPVAATPNAAIQDRVERALSELPNGASAVFVNLTGAERAARDPSAQVPAASTIKLPLMLEVFRQAQEGRLRLNDRHTVTQAQVVGGTGILREHVGATLTTLQLLQTTVVYSDNSGGNMLIRLVGSESVNRTMQQLGFGSTQLGRRFMDLEAERSGLVNVTSAADTAELLRQLYLGQLLEPRMRDEMLRILRCRGRRTDPDLDFLGRKLLPRPSIAHVNGALPGVRNDVGLIEKDGRAFILGIFLREQASEPAAEEAIARAAQQIADAVLNTR